jgi:hypothetical protein
VVFVTTLPSLKGLNAGFSTWRPGFAFGSVRVGFVVHKMAVGLVFVRVYPFALLLSVSTLI